jgi:hypothetical protein
MANELTAHIYSFVFYNRESRRDARGCSSRVERIGEMICPQCNAEYRPGFTRCADCDVPLVWEAQHAPGPTGAPAEPGDPNDDPFCSFWKGEDARVHAELCEVLDEAGVPHNTVFRRDRLFNLTNFPAFEIGVPFSLFEKAETAVKEAYATDDIEEVGTRELQKLLEDAPRQFDTLPEMLTPAEGKDIPGPPAAGDETGWFEEDATAKVWETEKGEPSDFLVAALHENGIRCRADREGSQAVVYVLPEDEDRARELVREVVEGKPPE